MRLIHGIVAGVIVLSTVAPSWAQYRYRSYRYAPSPPPIRQPTYPLPRYDYPDPDAPPPSPQEDGRRLWVYGSQGEGSFRQLPNGMWMESNSTGRYFFREVRRTPESIELYDDSRRASALLTDDMMYHHGPGDPVWHRGYQGSWE
jgi:hypothetical protein